ncbi:Ohr family peroxiredoxin [Rugamonas sp.]|uniref:Ohr family peroxiredoxin n=1 Tax=Rugamonas sp. TaxID=1926287 RepID=UPI0025F12F93|nr:Ohr family peroxiredoxin [Rugamonas sp.]
MSKIQKVLSTGKTHTTSTEPGGILHSHDANLNFNMTSVGNGAAQPLAVTAVTLHPTAEKMFAGAWSACYIAAVNLVAKEQKVTLPPDTAVDIEVDMGNTGNDLFLQARIKLIVPGIDQKVADALAHGADQICPYSKATRGNIDVLVQAVTA